MFHDPGLSTAEVRTETNGTIVLDWTLAWSDLGGLLGLDRGVRGILEAEELATAAPLLSHWIRESILLFPAAGSAATPSHVLVEKGMETTDIVLRVVWANASEATVHFAVLEDLPPGHRLAFRALCDPSSELVLLHGATSMTPNFRTAPTRTVEPVKQLEVASLQPGLMLICGAALLLIVVLMIRRRSSSKLAR